MKIMVRIRKMRKSVEYSESSKTLVTLLMTKIKTSGCGKKRKTKKNEDKEKNKGQKVAKQNDKK